MVLLKKVYHKSNYKEIKDDLLNYIDINNKKKNTGKKILKKEIKELDLLRYMKYVFLAGKYYKGNVNRTTLQFKNKEYHPYYFLEKKKDELIIVFKGTSEYNDFILDIKHYREGLNMILITHMNIISKILFYYNLIDYIQEYQGKKVTIVGFSLGAVFGSYLLLILKLIDKKKYKIENINFKMYSFNCPICVPKFYQKYINRNIIAVVNEKDPIVCFRGMNYTPLYTVGGNSIYNFIYNKKLKKVECFQRSYEYFNNIGIFQTSSLSTHRLRNLKKNIELFLEENTF